VCFQRGSGEAVPGCDGGESVSALTDFCVIPGVGDGGTSNATTPSLPAATPTKAPVKPSTVKPTIAPVAPTTRRPTAPSMAIYLFNVSGLVRNRPLRYVGSGAEMEGVVLQQCEGDCETDDDVSFNCGLP
jgi:hypothetical protein